MAAFVKNSACLWWNWKKITMEKNCLNCEHFENIKRRGQKYPKGFCNLHYAYRIKDGWLDRLSIFTPDEFVCDLHKPMPERVYILDQENNPVQITPIMAQDLQSQGWVLVKMDGNGNISAMKKQGE